MAFPIDAPVIAAQAPIADPAPPADPINRIIDRSRLKRSIVAKLRARITQLNRITANLHSNGGSGRTAHIVENRRRRIVNELRQLGSEWRAEALGSCHVNFQNAPAAARDAFFGND